MNKKSIFHTTFIVIILSFSQATADSISLLPPICRYISEADPVNIYYETCIQTLTVDPRSLTSTVPQLAQIVIELTIARARDIISTIESLLKSATAGPSAGANALRDCLGVYSRIPNQLGKGLEALRGRDLDTASASLSTAMNDVATCGNGIKQRTGNMGSLIQETNNFYQLSAISLSLTKLSRIIS